MNIPLMITRFHSIMLSRSKVSSLYLPLLKNYFLADLVFESSQDKSYESPFQLWYRPSRTTTHGQPRGSCTASSAANFMIASLEEFGIFQSCLVIYTVQHYRWMGRQFCDYHARAHQIKQMSTHLVRSHNVMLILFPYQIGLSIFKYPHSFIIKNI